MTWKELEAKLLVTIDAALQQKPAIWDAHDLKNVITAAAIAHEKAKEEA